MESINVGIADDHSLFREGIRMIISAMPGIILSLEADSGENLLAQLPQSNVDVILLDVEMKKLNGIETLKEVIRTKPSVRVIMLSMYTEPPMISHLMKLGACSYLKKDTQKDELEKAIRTVHKEGSYFNENISSALLIGLKNKAKTHALQIQLSTREREVLELICQELTTLEIGEKLFISERTVEGHRKNLYSKLGVKNTAGLVKKAMLMNLI